MSIYTSSVPLPTPHAVLVQADLETYRFWKWYARSLVSEGRSDERFLSCIEAWEAAHPNFRFPNHGRRFWVTLANGHHYEAGFTKDRWAAIMREWANRQAARLEKDAREADKAYSPRTNPGVACRAYAERLREAAALLRKPLVQEDS